jgi:plastocyanin
MFHGRKSFDRALATALVVAAVGITGAASAAPEVHKAAVHTIVIEKMKFGPVPSHVAAGDVIVWMNKDIFRHTATARDGSFNVDLRPGTSGKSVITHAGTIPFYCIFHPGMQGRLIVARR